MSTEEIAILELYRKIAREEAERVYAERMVGSNARLNIAKAAALVNRSPRTLRLWVSEGKVRYSKDAAGHLVFVKSELEEDVFG